MKISKLKGIETKEVCASAMHSVDNQEVPRLTQFSPGAG
jgi:hypothetical protein